MGSRKLTWLALAISIYLNLSVCQSICLRFYVFHLSAPQYPSFPSIHFHPSIHPSICLYLQLYPYIHIKIVESMSRHKIFIYILIPRSSSIIPPLLHLYIHLSLHLHLHPSLSFIYACVNDQLDRQRAETKAKPHR